MTAVSGEQVSAPSARRQRLFGLVLAGCVQFVVLTVVAMFFYPGGTRTDPATKGYRFFENFFSELGLTQSHAGGPNTISALLFFVALTLAGLALVLFFLLLPGFFRRTRPVRLLSWAGTLAGVAAGLSFVGVAFTPANLALEAHALFVQAAFLSFFVAVLFYLPAVLLTPDYPNRYAVVYAAFALLLAAYLWLLFGGPSPESPEAVILQATGQKVIVYAAIVTVLVQATGARRLERARARGV